MRSGLVFLLLLTGACEPPPEVCDGEPRSAPAQASAPRAVIRLVEDPASIEVNVPFHLDGSDSEAHGVRIVRFAWELALRPLASTLDLNDEDGPDIEVRVDSDGRYEFGLFVCDEAGAWSTEADTFRLDVGVP